MNYYWSVIVMLLILVMLVFPICRWQPIVPSSFVRCTKEQQNFADYVKLLEIILLIWTSIETRGIDLIFLLQRACNYTLTQDLSSWRLPQSSSSGRSEFFSYRKKKWVNVQILKIHIKISYSTNNWIKIFILSIFTGSFSLCGRYSWFDVYGEENT